VQYGGAERVARLPQMPRMPPRTAIAALDQRPRRPAVSSTPTRRRWTDRLIDATARRPRGLIAARPYRGRAGAPPGHDAIFARLLAEVGSITGVRCLDVGCGGGRLLERLLESRPFKAAGLDHRPAMLRASAQRNNLAKLTGRLELREGDAHALPWPDRTFDLIVSANTFFFLDRPAEALAEWRRALAPGGRVAIATRPGPLPAASIRNWWVAVWGPAMRVYDDARMRELLGDAGFVDIGVSSEAGVQIATGTRDRAAGPAPA
jgi:SAM-dependent methyltransferase